MNAQQAAAIGTLGVGGLGGTAYGGMVAIQTIQSNNEKKEQRRKFLDSSESGIQNLSKKHVYLGSHKSSREMWEFFWIMHASRMTYRSFQPINFDKVEKENMEKDAWQQIKEKLIDTGLNDVHRLPTHTSHNNV